MALPRRGRERRVLESFIAVKAFLLVLLLAGAAMVAPAQNAVLLDQSLHVGYARWQTDQQASALTRASYLFNTQMPVLDDSLGTLSLGGGVDYAQASGTPATLGMNSYAAQVTLFPYRPFHLLLDHEHNQSPGLAGGQGTRSDVYGLGLYYRGRTVQDLDLTYREGHTSLGGSGETWSNTTLSMAQQFGDTKAGFHAYHQTFASSDATGYQSTSLDSTFATKLNADWFLNTTLDGNEQPGTRDFSTGLSLNGKLGRWRSLTSLARSDMAAATGTSTFTMAAQSLILTAGKYNLFGSLSMGTSSALGPVPGLSQEALTLGGGYRLGRQWRVFGDVSTARLRGGDGGVGPGTSTQGGTHSYHLGVAEGGEVADLVKHVLFFQSERAFARRVQEDYAPGYLPTELVQEIQRRRYRESGRFGFTGDVFRSQVEGGGTRDWLRMTGDLKMTEGLRVATMGDLRRDAGMAQTGMEQVEKALSVNLSERFGRVSTLTGTLAFSRSNQRPLPGATVPLAAWAVGPELGFSSKTYALAFNSSVQDVPYGVLWTRFTASSGPGTTSLSSHLNLRAGLIVFQVTVSQMRRDDGLRSSMVTLDLVRAFDTIALYGFGRR